jgi:release factor glutamine methyltransferase
MKPIKAWLFEAEKKLSALTQQPTQEAIWLAEYILKKEKQQMLTIEVLSPPLEAELDAVLKRRMTGEPLAYILGSIPFLQANIHVEAPLLIPRPETEEWVDWLIKEIKKNKVEQLYIADLCTGTGCIGVGLSMAFPKATITAVDIMPQAVVCAEKNKTAHHLENLHIKQGNFFEPLEKNSYDLIVCNPPYLSKQEWETLDESVKSWETVTALTDHHDGLHWYRILATESHEYLKEKTTIHTPRIVCEIGYAQAEQITNIFMQAGWKNITVHQDLSKKDRWIAVY